jgi:hypothetical protein
MKGQPPGGAAAKGIPTESKEGLTAPPPEFAGKLVRTPSKVVKVPDTFADFDKTPLRYTVVKGDQDHPINLDMK